MARLRYFAAAAEAAGTTAEMVPADTLGALRTALVEMHGTDFAAVLARCSLLVDGVASDADDTPLPADALVDVLPPFAGG